MTFIPILNKSDFSLGLSISRVKSLCERCKTLGYASCGITERGNVFSAVAFSDECHKAGIKPILGSEIYVADLEGKLTRLNLLAKNYEGWRRLVKITTEANKKSSDRPFLDYHRLAEYVDENLICVTGQIGSFLGNKLFSDAAQSFGLDYDGAKASVVDNWRDVVSHNIGSLKRLFGDNLYLQIDMSDTTIFPAREIINKTLRYMGKQLNIKCVATPESHYINKDDYQDLWVILAVSLNCTIAQLAGRLSGVADWDNTKFIKSSDYFVRSEQDLDGYTQEEINNAGLIGEACESYKLTRDPLLPNFYCPNDLDPNVYLKQLCVEGWKRKIKGKVPEARITEYQARVREELDTFAEFALTTYMLIVADYVNAAKSRGEVVGPARGSAAGSLVSYLINITEIDPIPYNLLFMRFINKGRLIPGKISLPDVDFDAPIDKRIDTINYIKDKYGHNNVAAISTFGRSMGRGILSDVLRVHNVCSFEEIKNVTKGIPDEAAISDQIQESLDEGEDMGVILWALENNPKELSEYCILKDGVLSGRLCKHFSQSIRLEGIKKSRGKHAAGFVISPHPLGDNVPIIYDKEGEPVVAFDMRASESLGYMKVDILGIAALTKQKAILNLLEFGNIYEN